MSLIVTTEAVVLRVMKFRETSKIVTLYTKRFGKISGLAKGARQPKSKFAGLCLEPMSYVNTVLYKKAGREIQTISQCDIMKPFRRLSEDLDRMAAGLSIVELMNVAAHEEEENVPLFQLLVDSLSALNDAQTNPSSVVYYFQLNLAAISGFQPSFYQCIGCGGDVTPATDERNVQFHLSRGGMLCGKCAGIPGGRISLSEQAVSYLRQIAASPSAIDAARIDIDRQSREEIVNFLWTYLRHHVSGMRALRTTRVFSRILSPA